MAPVVHAILDTNPDFHTGSIDLFACGSTLGNLLRFVRGMDKPFRFNIEVVGDTVFFVRKENDPKELIKDVRGFGHTFPEAYTTWDSEVKGSDTHQRIVKYEFGRLNCLVRFESDGYIKGATTNSNTSRSRDSSKTEHSDLLEALQGTAISQAINPTSHNNGDLVIKHGGSQIPQHSIFDLKTRSGKHNRVIDMDDIYPLLWIKQIPNFIIAYHDGNGLFHNIKVQDVKKDVQAWEANNEDAIRRFSILLNKIIKIAKSDTRGLLDAYFSGSGGLEIRSQHGEGTHALPVDLMNKWADDGPQFGSTGCGASQDEDCKYEFDLGSDLDWESDEDDEDDEDLDYTACSVDDCGYCGKCMY